MSKKLKDRAKELIEPLEKKAKAAGGANPNVLADDKFKKCVRNSTSPAVFDKKGNIKKVEKLAIGREDYVLNKAHVKDEQDGIDADFRGEKVAEEYASSYYSEQHEDVMRVIKTADGSILSVPQRDIKRHTKKSVSMRYKKGQYEEIFGKKKKS